MRSAPKSILYLTAFFPPDPVAKRSSGVARTLAERGHRVTVLTRWPLGLNGAPCSASDVAASDDGLPDGVSVARLRGPRERRAASVSRRVAAQVGFSVQAVIRAVGLASRHDVVAVYTPPPFLGLSGLVASLLARRPLVLEVQDLYPDQAVALGVVDDGIVAYVARRVERSLYAGADRLVVVTDGYARHVRARGARSGVVVTVPNSADVDRFRPDTPPLDDGVLPRPVNALFAGTVGLAQGSEVVLEAALRLSERQEIGFEIFGGGARYDEMRSRARSMRLNNVRFAPAVSHPDMPGVLTRADILLLTLHPADIFGRVVPSKLSEYLAAGRPVAAAARGAVAELLRSAGAGVCVAPMDAAALAAAVARLADAPEERAAMGVRGRALAEKRFADGPVLRRLGDVILEACG